MSDAMSYSKAGVNIDLADATKAAMAESLKTNDARVLNRLGAFASLFDARFEGYAHPVLVLKTEEPGSKQKLALAHGRVRSICYDMVNHLINDIAVMGARPLSVQDAIICGKLEKAVVSEMVDAMASACREQGCTLTGGETSEQPGVLEAGTYILTSSVVGVVEKDKIVDGSKIVPGDVVLALASNGLHTNGYSLVRALLAQRPEILDARVEGGSFLDAILRPHTCYFRAINGLFASEHLHGLAHITGGGIRDNLRRILPATVDAVLDLGAIRILPVFQVIRQAGQVPDADMIRTFNLGAGLLLTAAPQAVDDFRRHLKALGCESYPVGTVVKGTGDVRLEGKLAW
ncbi:MAG: phosphoribosylformylglycinamidine cyclo-ligase [Planctomycetota bacterium]|nr:phosphoribosylformylglycinamidine cyclo-ligase [Planctomycetota bacterium]